jgi:hypothetical protein
MTRRLILAAAALLMVTAPAAAEVPTLTVHIVPRTTAETAPKLRQARKHLARRLRRCDSPRCRRHAHADYRRRARWIEAPYEWTLGGLVIGAGIALVSMWLSDRRRR